MAGNSNVRGSNHYSNKCIIICALFAVSDKDDSCEEMSIPSSPQNEAIQHSSISTSNGVSSSSTTPAVSTPSSTAATTSNQSTEESQQRRGATKSQPSGSWSSQNVPEQQHWGAVASLISLTNRGKRFSLSFSLDRTVFNLLSIDLLSVWSILSSVDNAFENAMFSLELWQKNRHFTCKM